VIDFPYFRRSRSAESWIGVSGFLISWAMRRAMSAQAEVRCATTSSVMSSRVTTKPCDSAGVCSVVTRTERLRSRFCRLIVTCPCTSRWMPSWALVIKSLSSGTTATSGCPITSGSSRSISFSAERLRMLMRPSPSTPMTPALAPASTASVNRRRWSIRSRARMMSSRWVRSS
jgi:hypothetical protein